MKKEEDILYEIFKSIEYEFEESQSSTEKAIEIDGSGELSGHMWNNHKSHIHNVLLGLLEEHDILYTTFIEYVKGKAIEAGAGIDFPYYEDRYGNIYIEITEIMEKV